MAYKNAEDILPDDLIKKIQKYTQGVSIYIPKIKNKRAGWGTLNNTRDRLRKRNEEIYLFYEQGKSVDQLANEYFLSDKSIWRIIRELKR